MLTKADISEKLTEIIQVLADLEYIASIDISGREIIREQCEAPTEIAEELENE